MATDVYIEEHDSFQSALANATPITTQNINTGTGVTTSNFGSTTRAIAIVPKVNGILFNLGASAAAPTNLGAGARLAPGNTRTVIGITATGWRLGLLDA